MEKTKCRYHCAVTGGAVCLYFPGGWPVQCSAGANHRQPAVAVRVSSDDGGLLAAGSGHSSRGGKEAASSPALWFHLSHLYDRSVF